MVVTDENTQQLLCRIHVHSSVAGVDARIPRPLWELLSMFRQKKNERDKFVFLGAKTPSVQNIT